ncbi:MAG: chemotaxis protein CheX [Bdellovibrionales bacterium]|nr:chemotaxis protein CheX [Bdellovibrionales bacterium]
MKTKIEDFLSPFVTATETTLLDLCKTRVQSTRILTGDSLPTEPARFAALIGITSPTIQGSMSVNFPEPVFLELMNRMLGETMTQIAPGLEDGAAEITNIIFGNAKTKLNELGFNIQMALPTLLRGKRIESIGSRSSPNLLGVQFTLDSGPLWILFELGARSATEVKPPENTSMKEKNWSPEMLLEFVKAVRKTMEVQFGSKIEVGQPFRNQGESRFVFDVGSIIGVTDEHFSGFFGMYYQSETFLKLMNRLLDTEFTELNEENQDGASEITNICFGVAKQVLNQQGHQIQMALPCLIRGSEIESANSGLDEKSAITVPLNTEHGKLWIEFGYKEIKG